jgi:hypothetical protein
VLQPGRAIQPLSPISEPLPYLNRDNAYMRVLWTVYGRAISYVNTERKGRGGFFKFLYENRKAPPVIIIMIPLYLSIPRSYLSLTLCCVGAQGDWGGVGYWFDFYFRGLYGICNIYVALCI